MEITRRIFVATLLGLSVIGASTARGQQFEETYRDGRIALRFVSGEKHGSTFIIDEKRDGEQSLGFLVSHYHAVGWAQGVGCSGVLYVTPTRIIYESQNREHSFSLLRSEIKKAEAQKSGRFGKNIGNHILIDTKTGDRRFAIVFDAYAIWGFQGDYVKPVLAWFERTVDNFESAYADFNRLTVTARNRQREEAEVNARLALLQQEKGRADAAQAALYESQLNDPELRKRILASLTPEVISAVRESLRSLRKLAGATKIGVSFEQYGSRLIDVNAEVEEVVPRLADSPLKNELRLALEAFVDANTAWNETRKSKHATLFPDLEPGAGLMKKYSIPVDKSIGVPLLPQERVLSAIWSTAQVHIDRASALVSP